MKGVITWWLRSFTPLQLQKQITDTRCAEIDCADVLDPNTPVLERIRLLDARLVRIFRRTKDTQLVELHFRNLLKPMRQEKEVFGSQVPSPSPSPRVCESSRSRKLLHSGKVYNSVHFIQLIFWCVNGSWTAWEPSLTWRRIRLCNFGW